MTTQNIYDLADTWNAGATTFTAIKMNVTDTASAAASLLMDLQVGGSSRFSVTKSGAISAKVNSDSVAFLLPEVGSGTGFGVDQTRPAIFFNATPYLRFSSAQVQTQYSYALGANSTTMDVILSRRAAANLRLGAADAAAPVAQTLSVQSVVAGTTNTAGANFTITGSQGTGTGAGGSIIFQVAPAGSSGTAQNALATALTISGDRSAVFAGRVDQTGAATVWGNGSYGSYNGSAFLEVQQSLGFSAGSIVAGSVDVIIRRDAANTLALRNGANAQAFRVYNTYDGTNDERLSIYWAGNNAYMLTGAIGAGVNRDLSIGTAAGNASLNFWTNAATRWKIDGANGHLLAGADNTYDIGASAASRPRNIYTAGTVVASGGVQAGNSNTYAWLNGSYLFGGATTGAISGAFRLVGSGSTTTLNFGGDTSSFPAIKRSSTTLQARLADDSAFASVQGKLTTDTAYAAGDPTTTGYLVVYDSTGTAYKIPAVAV